MFLKQLFLSFGFPDLNDFLSLIPADRQAQVFLLYDTDRVSESLTNSLSGSQRAFHISLCNECVVSPLPPLAFELHLSGRTQRVSEQAEHSEQCV